MLANGEDSGQFEGHALWRRAVGNRVRDCFDVAVSCACQRDDGGGGAAARRLVRRDCFRQ